VKLVFFTLIPIILSIGIIPLLSNIDAEETKTIFIDSHLVDCVGVGPQKCMLVRDNQNPQWSNFYDNIDGFTFVEGNTYQLSVKITDIENPPADASSLKYELLEIITKNSNQICIDKVWIENKKGKIACVTPTTSDKLVERGWGIHVN